MSQRLLLLLLLTFTVPCRPDNCAAAPAHVLPVPDLAAVLQAARTTSPGTQTLLSPARLHRGVPLLGHTELLATPLRKLEARRCLRVLALGGSVTKGNGLEGMVGTSLAYPQLFVDALNHALPCDGGQHVVRNLGTGGVGNENWLDALAEAPHSDEPIRPDGWSDSARAFVGGFQHVSSEELAGVLDADLILVDTAFNDGVGATAQRGTRAEEASTEVLLRLLLSLPQRPGVILLVTCFRTDLPHASDVVDAQKSVAAAYGVPVVDAVAAVGPISSVSDVHWFDTVFIGHASQGGGTTGHPSCFGHAVLAQLVVHALLLHYGELSVPLMAGRELAWPAVPPPLPPLQWASQHDSDMFTLTSPSHVDVLHHAPTSQTAGWRAYEDKKGKLGLIANQTGESVTFYVPLRRGSSGAVLTTVLKSYDRMGVLVVEVRSAPKLLPAGGRGRSRRPVGLAALCWGTSGKTAAWRTGCQRPR